MERKDFIKENMNSTDPFVSELFQELNERVGEFEANELLEGHETFSYVVPLIIVLLISSFMVFVLM